MMCRAILVMLGLLAITGRARAETPAPTPTTTSAPDTPTPTTPAPSTSTPTPTASAPAPAATRTPPTTDEVEGEPKLSLPTEADRQAWQNSGFRLSLAVAYGQLVGLRGAPSGRLLAAKLRVGLRLDRQWSLMTSYEYARASQPRGLSGLRFTGTLDPTWHVTPSVSLAVGFGFGGIVEGRNTGRPDIEPFAETLETSYTFPDASPPIASCSGIGTAALARAEWGVVLGPRSQLAVAAEATGQWTGCVQDTNRFEPDSGKAIVRRQWWPHAGFTLAAGFTWR